MPNYQGKTKGTRRIIIWQHNKPLEKVIRATKREADEFEARWRLELQGNEPADPRLVPLFSDFCVSRYRPHAEKHLKASTWEKSRIYQVDTLCKHFGHLRLTEFTLVAIENFQDARQADLVTWHGKTAAMKNSSINIELRILRTILNWAKELGYPVPKLKWKRLPERGKGHVRAWTTSEVQALYAAAQARYPSLVPMFVFLMNTGCRKGEAIAAEWSWMDWEAGLVRIPSNPSWQPKNGLPREIPISDAVRAVLQMSTSANGVRSVMGAGVRYLFQSREGSRYACFPQVIFDDIREKAGVTGGPHTFRHTFASHFLRATKDLKLLSMVMGHSLQKVTELYTHMLPDHLEEARNAVNLGPALTMVEEPNARRK